MATDNSKLLNNLKKEDWRELESIYQEIINHKEPFYKVIGGKKDSEGVIEMPWHKYSPTVLKLFEFLYSKNLIIDFDWVNWDESVKIWNRNGKNKYKDLSLDNTIKLFTEIARGDRFSEGLWAQFFESGDAELLVARLIEFKSINDINDKKESFADIIVGKLITRQNTKCVNNFYSGHTSASDTRLDNVKRYLKYYEEHPPKIILIGEAPGHRGCAQSGIPFTSPFVASENTFLKEKIKAIGAKSKENTATIVWGLFDSIEEYPMLWNAFPFHPHKETKKATNRKPNKEELLEGLGYIQLIQDAYPNARLVAVGNIAYDSLKNMGLDVAKVRHPSYGGKAQFEEQLKSLL